MFNKHYIKLFLCIYLDTWYNIIVSVSMIFNHTSTPVVSPTFLANNPNLW